MARSVLVIDDEQSIRATLSGALEDEGYRVFTAESGRAGLELIRSERPDIVLLDIWMPEMDGIETLKRIKSDWPDQPVVMMSGHGTIETAVKSTKLGAFDFVEKPLSLERILVLLQNAASVQDLARENQALRKQIQKSKKLVGESPAMAQIRDRIARVAPTTGSVLILGENGTGKELVAHSIHAASPRYNKPFVEVNCAAIPEELIESELFGHERGAFTGATQLRRGKFDLANGGTILLDEIGDMSMKTQAKILRILQEQKFERVGGTQTIEVDVRVLAATNKDLKEEIRNGNFREDLFYRLNVIPFQVPSLRERGEDIRILASHFAMEMAAAHGRARREFSPEAMKVLDSYDWPGNVRELRNLIERMIILTPESEEGNPVTAAQVLELLNDEGPGRLGVETEEGAPESLVSASIEGPDGKPKNLRQARHEFEKEYILRILNEQDGNISKTAAVLGIERSHLHKKIKSFGIQ